MTRRRRRVKVMGSSVRLFASIVFTLNLIFLLECNNNIAASAHSIMLDNLDISSQKQVTPQQQTVHQQIQSSQISNSHEQHHRRDHHSISQLCAMMSETHQTKHLKLCKLVAQSPQADEAIASGAARGLAECRQQFRSERWNCTHAHGEQHLLTSKLAQSVGNRESAFVQAIAAAGIVHSIATACSQGSLSDCACDKTRVGLIRQKDQIWKWGGCSNNIRHGMTFAKHLVELLDAVHQHQQVKHHRSDHDLHKRRTNRKKRALSFRNREPNQVRNRSSVLGLGEFQQTTNNEPTLSFCHNRNQNISQAAHLQLIKSLLSKDSLEKHQDFRLAMNMHNNKIGRVAVAKNMEIKCRCHGLSGSCSLKTCWLKLPDFQQIGTYLKRKYDVSIHLPSAVNVNKLIPMMDRNEISSILSSSSSGGDSSFHDQAATNRLPQYAALTSATTTRQSIPVSPAPAVVPTNAVELSTSQPLHFNFYERHKQLEQLAASNQNSTPQTTPTIAQNNESHEESGGLQTESSNIDKLQQQQLPASVAPMTQQQYQGLLKELRLCSSSTMNTSQSQATSYLTTRDLQQSNGRQQSLHKKLVVNNQQSHNQMNSIKVANHQLNQLLHNTNSKDDLIHLHKSPNYCEADLKSYGFAGVQARICNAHDALAPDSCDKLCCGRGYETRETQIRYNCDCKFQYCCKIHCNLCHKKVVEYVCK